jgi:hypothetical protein
MGSLSELADSLTPNVPARMTNLGANSDNLLVGLYLFSRHPVTLEFTPDLLVPLAGALAIGLFMSVHFGKVWRDKHVR